MPTPVDYSKLSSLSSAIEVELKSIGAWSNTPLPEEKFENMGPFGINTMALVEWIQFVLLPIIQNIIKDKGNLPKESMISVHAAREFDGDDSYVHLCDLLMQLDNLANGEESKSYVGYYDKGGHYIPAEEVPPNLLPRELFDLAHVLPTFEGDFLEEQLRTFDLFLPSLPVGARTQMANLLISIADQATTMKTKLRLGKAYISLNAGESICKPYNHAEEMKKYQEQFKKDFPNATFDPIPDDPK
jgi:uncharacterized protein YqcC (DUF446 family)